MTGADCSVVDCRIFSVEDIMPPITDGAFGPFLWFLTSFELRGLPNGFQRSFGVFSEEVYEVQIEMPFGSIFQEVELVSGPHDAFLVLHLLLLNPPAILFNECNR